MAKLNTFSLFLFGCSFGTKGPSEIDPADPAASPASRTTLLPVAAEYSPGPTDCPSGALPVPGGRVVMGQDHGDAGQDESPVHTVHVDGFCLDRTEMTVEVRGETHSALKAIIVEDWNEAREVCALRGGRLPTEAEFEKAARGGCELGTSPEQCDAADMRHYPWGDGRPTCQLANHSAVSPRGPQRCHSGPDDAAGRAIGAGPYGHVNLSGNLWEPMSDWYHPKIYREGRPDNPGGPPSGRARVLRGGAWDTFATNMRISNRFSDHIKGSSLGVRCVFGGAEPTIEWIEPIEWVDVKVGVRMKNGQPIAGRWLTVTAFGEADVDRSGLPKPGISPIAEGGARPEGLPQQTVSLAVPRDEMVRFSAALDSGAAVSGPMPAASSGGIGWVKQGMRVTEGLAVTVVVEPLPSRPHTPRP